MSLSVVSAQLKQWADNAALKATRANDPDSIHALNQAADQFRKLMETVQGAAVELEVSKRKPAPRRAGGMNAFGFWLLHGQAVDAIIAVYGLDWKTRAPFGDTALATVPTWCRSGKTEKGGIVRWSKDHRVPGARFWPDRKFPTGLEISPDYEREGEVKRVHDPAWHKAHGYVWDRGEWRFEIEVRNALNRSEAIEAYKEAKRLAKLECERLAEVDDQQMAAE